MLGVYSRYNFIITNDSFQVVLISNSIIIIHFKYDRKNEKLRIVRRIWDIMERNEMFQRSSEERSDGSLSLVAFSISPSVFRGSRSRCNGAFALVVLCECLELEALVRRLIRSYQFYSVRTFISLGPERNEAKNSCEVENYPLTFGYAVIQSIHFMASACARISKTSTFFGLQWIISWLSKVSSHHFFLFLIKIENSRWEWFGIVIC